MCRPQSIISVAPPMPTRTQERPTSWPAPRGRTRMVGRGWCIGEREVCFFFTLSFRSLSLSSSRAWPATLFLKTRGPRPAGLVFTVTSRSRHTTESPALHHGSPWAGRRRAGGRREGGWSWGGGTSGRVLEEDELRKQRGGGGGRIWPGFGRSLQMVLFFFSNQGRTRGRVKTREDTCEDTHTHTHTHTPGDGAVDSRTARRPLPGRRRLQQ